MAVKDGNKVVPITLTRPQRIKLRLMCNRSGLSKTNMIQRLIDKVDLFEKEKKEMEALLKEPPSK